MKLRLATRASLFIVGLIVFIVVALSGALLVQFGAVMSEMRRSNSDVIASALFEQAEKQGTGLTQLLAAEMTNPMYRFRMDVIYDLVSSARDQKGIVYVYVYDEAGALVHDGTETLEAYGTRMDEPARQAIAAGRGFTWKAENSLHIAAPIKIGSRVLGSVVVGVSLEEISRDIAAIEGALVGISNAAVANHIFATVFAAVVLASLGVVLSLLVVRGLARPIEAIAGVTRRIGRGEYDVQVSVERSDEIGDLAAAFNQMAGKLKSHEKALKESRDTLERRVEERTEELLKATQAKSEFMASMSHELRTPLNSIIGFAQMISNQYLGPLGNNQYVDYAKDIASSGQHLLSMVNDILDIERIEAGQYDLRMENVDAFGVVNECLRLLGSKADRGEVSLTVSVDDDLPPLHVDRRALLQVLINLLTNAVKFTTEGGEVVLTASASKTEHRFEVRDTGVGIPKDKILTLTDPFTRHDPDPHVSQDGVGLGLAISKSLVELHGGELRIDSEVGKGTVVTVTLPSAAP